jgi:hypothetical protein
VNGFLAPIGQITPQEAEARGLTADHIGLDSNGGVLSVNRKAHVSWPRACDVHDNPPLPSSGVGFGLGEVGP